ncbi:PfkB family carbohydrate kinase [Wenyingzhuangia sp. IMCC45467]
MKVEEHKVITFGEILGRLSPPNNLRFSQATNLEVVYGGGEFNVAGSLANYGVRTQFVTAIPDNAIGDCVIQSIRSRNVGAKHILRQGQRLGLYFLENGASGRNSSVVYDRANSSISEVKLGQFDWDAIFKDATIFHWSGITPALSQTAAEVCLEAIEAAVERGLTISTDLNYRSKLWKYGKQPKEVMPALLKHSNIVLADVDTAMFMLGKEKINPDYSNDNDIKHQFDKIMEMLPKVHTIGMTFRNSVNASHQRIGGLLYKNKELYRARIKEITPVVDRVGTGDAFMGGLLYGLIGYQDDLQKAVSFATAACVIKHTIFGDVNRASKQEVIDFMESDGSALVDR